MPIAAQVVPISNTLCFHFQMVFQGAGYSGGGAVPSSNVGENEIVFGGHKKLDELIKASLKIMDGDIFVVLTGCAVETDRR